MTEGTEFNHKYHTILANSQNINSRAAVLMYNQSSVNVDQMAHIKPFLNQLKYQKRNKGGKKLKSLGAKGKRYTSNSRQRSPNFMTQ